MQDYESLCTTVTICGTLINRQTLSREENVECGAMISRACHGGNIAQGPILCKQGISLGGIIAAAALAAVGVERCEGAEMR